MLPFFDDAIWLNNWLYRPSIFQCDASHNRGFVVAVLKEIIRSPEAFFCVGLDGESGKVFKEWCTVTIAFFVAPHRARNVRNPANNGMSYFMMKYDEHII